MLQTLNLCRLVVGMRVASFVRGALTLWFITELSSGLRKSKGDSWDYLSLRYGVWYEPPMTVDAALKLGYNRRNNNCKTTKHVGFLYHRHGDLIAMPIYDSNGRLAGIQSAIPGNMIGYDSLNESIPLPPSEVKPPFLHGWTNSHGVPMYTLTAYFSHPRIICNPTERRVWRGRGLYIQVGDDAETSFIEIPLHSRNLDPMWTRGSCIATMGQHYFRKLSRHLPCEEIYPVFLMYDTHGQLGAFGWSFQGKPQQPTRHNLTWFRLEPKLYPFLFAAGDLPSCMYNNKFRVSGIHIWLKPPRLMTCDTDGARTRDNARVSTTHAPSLSRYMVLVKNDESERNSDSAENRSYEALDGRGAAKSIIPQSTVIFRVVISLLCMQEFVLS